MKKIFKGIMPALVTPFEADGKTVNEKALCGLIDHLLLQGADGFYIGGSTGEGIVMTEQERKRLSEIAISHIGGRKPAICHIAAINFDEALRLAKHAEKTGADAISAIPPVFFSYNEKSIFKYYEKLAEATNLPFIIYNHPSVGGGMGADMVAELFKIDNITGVKWTVNNYYELMNLKDKTHGEMNIINGPDEMLVSGLAAGADAGIGTTYNVMLPQFLQIYESFNSGNCHKAREIQLKVNRVIKCMLKWDCIPATKYMCSLMGFDCGEANFPFTRQEDKWCSGFREELESVGWPIK